MNKRNLSAILGTFALFAITAVAFNNCSAQKFASSQQVLMLEQEDTRSFKLLDEDMLVEADANEPAGQEKAGRDLTDIKASYWKNGLIPLKFESGFKESEKTLVRDACKKWSLVSKVKCVTYVSSTHGSNYLNVTKTGDGCYASFGKPNSGPGYLNLSDSEAVTYSLPKGTCMMPGIAMHEFGHVLGMAHEHSRTDRDTYIFVNTANLKSTCVSAFTFKYATGDLVRVGSYDFKSIMHYSWNHCSANGKATMSPRSSYNLGTYKLGDAVLVNAQLSGADASFASAVYGAP